jgi:hypothetical protein
MGRGMGLQASHRPAASCRHRIRRFEIGAAKPATSRASFISFRPARAGYLAKDRTAAAGGDALEEGAALLRRRTPAATTTVWSWAVRHDSMAGE